MAEALAIFLIAEDPIVRAALADGLGRAGLRVIAEAANPAEARATPIDRAADVTIWDLGLRPEAALDQATDAWPDPERLLVIVPDSEIAAEALSHGAHGVIARASSAADLAAAARAVAAGLVVLSPSVLPKWQSNDRTQPSTEDLTPREAEVLELLVEGLSNKGIAARLAISEHTAKFHVNAVLQKLGAQTRTEAVVRAARLGLVTL